MGVPPEQQKRENSRSVYRNYHNLIHASNKRRWDDVYLQSKTVDPMQQIFFLHDDDDRQALRATLRSCLVCKWKETKKKKKKTIKLNLTWNSIQTKK